jgi:hypothetical protein
MIAHAAFTFRVLAVPRLVHSPKSPLVLPRSIILSLQRSLSHARNRTPRSSQNLARAVPLVRRSGQGARRGTRDLEGSGKALERC